MRNWNALAQVIRPDPVRGLPDEPHRPQREAAQHEADDDTHGQHRDQQRRADLHVSLHDLANLPRGSGNSHIEGRQHELRDAQLADSLDLGIVAVLPWHIGDRAAFEVVRIEHRAVLVAVNVDKEENRGVFGRLADALVDHCSIQRLVVGPEAGADLLELGGIQQVQAVNQIALQQLVADDEQTRQRNRRGHCIPRRQARADRFHNSW